MLIFVLCRKRRRRDGDHKPGAAAGDDGRASLEVAPGPEIFVGSLPDTEGATGTVDQHVIDIRIEDFVDTADDTFSALPGAGLAGSPSVEPLSLQPPGGLQGSQSLGDGGSGGGIGAEQGAAELSAAAVEAASAGASAAAAGAEELRGQVAALSSASTAGAGAEELGGQAAALTQPGAAASAAGSSFGAAGFGARFV